MNKKVYLPEQTLLQRVHGTQDHPMLASALVQQVSHEAGVPEMDVREALWKLLHADKLSLTSDRRVTFENVGGVR